MRQLRALVAVTALVLAGQAAAGRSQQPTTYTVRRGDTLSHIAVRLGTTVDALTRANQLANPHKLRPGQVLKVAAPTKPAKPAPAPATSTRPALSSTVIVLGAEGARTYTVARGDNLSTIAKRFGVTVADLAKANKMRTSAVLQAGRRIAIPGGSWTCPARGRFTNDWGDPRSGGRRHQGNDIFAPKGTPVVAPVAGTLYDGTGGLGGIGFLLRGVDGVTYYGAHLDALTAKPGPIAAGARIGTVGDTGNAKGGPPHLHFETRVEGTPVNPFHTLERWCR